MKAFTVDRYGDPEEVVILEEVDKPEPEKDQVRIKVKSATVNDYDWSVATGEPKSYRLLFGLSKPKKRFRILGMEASGIVDALGPEAEKYKIGDAVYGDTSNHGHGTVGEYFCVSEQALCLKPEVMSFEEAAAIPHAAMLAYEGLIDMGALQKGQKVLINGAGGGMGSFAVQIAKTMEGEVTGVDSGEKFEMMQSLGFDHLIDYRKDDFTRNGEKYDLILDARTARSPFSLQRSLKKGGNYVTVGGKTRWLLPLLLMSGLFRLITGKRFRILALRPNLHLERINQWYEEGKIKPVIDGPHPFEQIPRLVRYFGDAKHKGKIVVSMK